MKARVKSTGVLIDVIPKYNANAQHSGDNLYVCDNMVFRECELDFLNVGNSVIDWESRRYNLAKEVMLNLINKDFGSAENVQSVIKEAGNLYKFHSSLAVKYADALIEELRKEE